MSAPEKPSRMTTVQRAELALERAKRKEAERAARKEAIKSERALFKAHATMAIRAFRVGELSAAGFRLQEAGKVLAVAYDRVRLEADQ